MKRIKTLMGMAVVALSLLLPVNAHAQRVGVKTNLLSDVGASPYLGIEVGLARKLTLDVSGTVKFWDFPSPDNMTLRHWEVQPEFRYWTCQRFAGHFFGLHGLAGQFNYGGFPNFFKYLGTYYSDFINERHQGWAFGGGLGYGYALPLGKHWNMEFELGAGAIYTISNGFSCDGGCAVEGAQDVRKLRPAITKAAFSIVYLF